MVSVNLSRGPERRISISVEGWPRQSKESLAANLRALEGVTDVRSAGGGTSFYVNYDPEIVEGEDLARDAHEIGTAILNEIDADMPTADSDQITVDSSNLTMDSAHRQFADAAETNAGAITPSPGMMGMLGGGPLAAAPLAGGVPTNETANVNSSAWTGIRGAHSRAAAVKTMVPVAIEALETLIAEAETAGHNNGPPLEDRQQAVDVLREFHRALGELLAAADRPSFLEDAGEGLLVEITKWGARACEKMKNDPMCYAMSALIFAVCAAVGAPGAGGLLGSMALTIQTNRCH